MTPCVDMCTQKCLPAKSLSTNSLPWHIPKQNVLQDFKMRLAFELYFRSKLVCYALRILYTCTASLATGFLYSTSDLFCLNSGESILGEFLIVFHQSFVFAISPHLSWCSCTFHPFLSLAKVFATISNGKWKVQQPPKLSSTGKKLLTQ